MAGQMAYCGTHRGAKVFAAGAFTLGGSATRSYGRPAVEQPLAPHESGVTENPTPEARRRRPYPTSAAASHS